MDQQQSGTYRAHKRSSGNYKPPTCEDATATDMSDSQPERPTRQHHRDGAEPRPPLQPTTANVPASTRFTGQATGPATYQQSGYTGHPLAPVQSTYSPLYGNSPIPMTFSSSYQTPSYPGRYASNTSVPYSFGGQYAQPPYLYPPTTQPPVGYSDPRRYSYSDEYYPPEPANSYPSRPPPRAPRPPRVDYGYGPRSATPAPKATERPPLPKKKAPARPASARPPEDNAVSGKLLREISKINKRMRKIEMGQEDLLSDTGRVRSEFMLPSASLAGRNSSSAESVQALEHIRRIIDDCLRKPGKESVYYGDSSVNVLGALVRDKLAEERRESMEPKDDRSFRRRVIEVLQDIETQDGRWERRSTAGGSTTREEKRRSGGHRSTTSSDPPMEPVTPPSSYSMPQRAGKTSSVSPEPGRSRGVEYIYEIRQRGAPRTVHSDEETVSRPPITRRPEPASYQGGRTRRRSMVEPERGSYGRPRVYSGTEDVAVDDYEEEEEERPRRRTTMFADRRSTPYAGGGLGHRFRTDPTSAPSSSTRWSREGGVYDAR